MVWFSVNTTHNTHDLSLSSCLWFLAGPSIPHHGSQRSNPLPDHTDVVLSQPVPDPVTPNSQIPVATAIDIVSSILDSFLVWSVCTESDLWSTSRYRMSLWNLFGQYCESHENPLASMRTLRLVSYRSGMHEQICHNNTTGAPPRGCRILRLLHSGRLPLRCRCPSRRSKQKNTRKAMKKQQNTNTGVFLLNLMWEYYVMHAQTAWNKAFSHKWRCFRFEMAQRHISMGRFSQ